jgi:uncharacterized coiled-coil DUF342 family protein
MRLQSAKRMMKQAEMDLEANGYDKEASNLEKQANNSLIATRGLSMPEQQRRELMEKAAELRLKANEIRNKSMALTLEGAEAQLKMERLSSQASKENLNSSRLRLEFVRAEKKIGEIEQEMREAAEKSQGATSGGRK